MQDVQTQPLNNSTEQSIVTKKINNKSSRIYTQVYILLVGSSVTEAPTISMGSHFMFARCTPNAKINVTLMVFLSLM